MNTRVIVARHVDIVDRDTKCIGLDENNHEPESNKENDVIEDLLICSKDQKEIGKIRSLLPQKFNMKDLGKIKGYLGIIIEYNPY